MSGRDVLRLAWQAIWFHRSARSSRRWAFSSDCIRHSVNLHWRRCAVYVLSEFTHLEPRSPRSHPARLRPLECPARFAQPFTY